MSDTSRHPDHTSLPPFVRPYAETYDRMQQRETLRPEQLTDRARALLLARCSGSAQPVEAAFAHGAVGLLGGHTHYFDGFALLMPLAQGSAVALRETDEARSQLFFEGAPDAWTFDAAAPGSDRRKEPPWVRMVEAVVRWLTPTGRQVKAAVVSTVQAGCMDAYLAALAVATVRAVQALFARPESTADLLPGLRQIAADSTGLPFSVAYLIAAEAGQPPTFTLVDTATREHLPVEASGGILPGWGLIDVETGRLHKAGAHWERKKKADKALALLQQNGFDHLTSLRDLEHRDLHAALDALPRRFRPVVRHLVTENRRVQKLVVATRRSDWQMFGTLLLMSHASLRDDWKQTNEEVDFVVEQVEAMTLDGMYGACVTGRSGCVLVVGQPFVVPRCLDRVRDAFEARFRRIPETVLL